MNYYHMIYAEDEEYAPFGMAYATEDVDLFVLPPGGTPVQSWVPLILELKDGDFADYLANALGVRLCSVNMRQVIDSHISKGDSLQWVDAKVTGPNDDLRSYYILHFPVDIPVINQSKSLMAGDMVVKAVLKDSLVKGHEIFGLPGEGGRRTYVSENMRRAIELAHLSGMTFANVKVA